MRICMYITGAGDLTPMPRGAPPYFFGAWAFCRARKRSLAEPTFISFSWPAGGRFCFCRAPISGGIWKCGGCVC